MELFKNTNFDFLGKKWPFIGLSLLLTAAGLVSLVLKGGPRYGIDFRGGALVTVRFAHRPPADEVRKALGKRLPTIEVQEVTGSNDDIIGTDVHDDKELETAERTIVDELKAAFGQNNGKLDINATGAAALADRLQVPLQRAAIPMSEPQ